MVNIEIYSSLIAHGVVYLEKTTDNYNFDLKILETCYILWPTFVDLLITMIHTILENFSIAVDIYH
jgi:hypothetical protein